MFMNAQGYTTTIMEVTCCPRKFIASNNNCSAVFLYSCNTCMHNAAHACCPNQMNHTKRPDNDVLELKILLERR